MYYLKLFENFLKENDAFDKYVDNFESKSHFDNFEEMVSIIGPTSFVVGVFSWEETNNGLTYWAEIDSKWQEVLENV